MKEEAANLKPLLFIDPGHGGNDPGGGSCEYFTEAEMNLKISLYQYMRCYELGIPVAITRNTDIYVSANSRSKMIRDSGAKYCISNHINAALTPTAEGASTIHSIYADGKLARSILSELQAEGQKIRRAYTRESTNSPKSDYYFMHWQTGKVETVIIEYGFATNDNDKKKIHVLWKVYAEAALRGFCLFAGIEYKPTEKEPDKILGYKMEGMDYLYNNGLITDPSWKKEIEEPLPRWAIGLILKRALEKGDDDA